MLSLVEIWLDPPAADSGLTLDDIRETVRRLRAAVREFPALEYLVENVPPEFDPDVEPGAGAVVQGGTILVVELGPRLTRAQKNAALDAIQELYNRAAADINAELLSGSITVEQWTASMRDELKAGHVSAYVAGRSGAWSSISFSEWGRLGSRIKRQYEYLKRFADDIKARGVDNISAGYLKERARLYGDNMRESLEAGIIRDRGLDPSVFPAMPGDGSTKCLVRCKCRWTVRPSGRERYLVSWKLGNAEHCETCLSRSVDWVNLEIVRGRMVSQVIPHFYNR